MKKYLKHVKDLFERPILNGIDGKLEKRSASPFELFFDLIFVIAISKLAIYFEQTTFVHFIQAILVFCVIYSIWFTLTTYTVMFLKKNINYWSRTMFFLIMIPIIIFLSVNNLDTRLNNFIFYSSLASTKLILAFIFRDSIVNAPLNNITVSNVYLIIFKTQILSAILLLVNSVVPSTYIQIPILLLIALIEYIYIPYKTKRVVKKQYFSMPVNHELFMERQLLFTILVFGESLVAVVTTADFSQGISANLNVITTFIIMFLFYIRLSEESEHNQIIINKSNDMFNWLKVNLAIFLLFQILVRIPEQVKRLGHIDIKVFALLVIILLYICGSHLMVDIMYLKEKETPIQRLFYKLDIKMLALMLCCIIVIIIFRNSLVVINLALVAFFAFHIFALPFREHLIREKCELRESIEVKYGNEITKK